MGRYCGSGFVIVIVIVGVCFDAGVTRVRLKQVGVCGVNQNCPGVFWNKSGIFVSRKMFSKDHKKFMFGFYFVKNSLMLLFLKQFF